MTVTQRVGLVGIVTGLSCLVLVVLKDDHVCMGGMCLALFLASFAMFVWEVEND